MHVIGSRCVLFAMMLHGCLAAASPKGLSQEWPTVGGDDANTRYSSLSQINRRNVARLRGAWTIELDAPTRSSPVMVNGSLFVSDARGVSALDPVLGKKLWAFTPEKGSPAFGGVAVGSDLVYVGLSDATIVALDQVSGQQRWKSFIGNGPRTVEAAKIGLVSNAPVLVNGLVVSGVSGGDWGAPGKIVALDAKTGRLAWSFSVVPEAGSPGSDSWPPQALPRGGGAVWTHGAADPKLHMVYYGTGNPISQLGGETRAGNNLFTDSIVALDTSTGKLRWHFQMTHHDLWEMDMATPLVLYDPVIDGIKKEAIAAMRTDGFLFFLDRRTGKPISPVEERAVKQDARLSTSATQPFPVGADKFGPTCADRAEIPPGFEVGCQYDPIYFDHQNRVAPLSITRQAPMSFDPQTGYFYVMGGVTAVWMRRVENPDILLMSHPPGSQEYGIYGAIDSRTHKLIWQQHSAWGMATGSGALTTAGGLLFHMEGDGNLVASDVRNGSKLWTFQTGLLATSVFGNAGSVPLATYALHGQQYVLAPMGKGLWAFTLTGRILPRAALTPPASSFGFTDTIKQLPLNGTAAIHVGVWKGGFIEGTGKFLDEYAFEPTRSKITLDMPINWINDGTVAHTIVSADGSWTTGPIAPGHSVTLKVANPGAYEFFSKESPWGRGYLLVQPLLAESNGASNEHSVFTQEQASRGKDNFEHACSACHMSDLAGSERVPGLAGDAFARRWKESTEQNLFDKIRRTMPPNAPNSLDNRQYVEILAYLLQSNGYEPGTKELAPDSTMSRSLQF